MDSRDWKALVHVRFFRHLAEACPEEFLAIHDFAWAPYALGDAATWLMKCWTRAIDHGISRMRCILVQDPQTPSNRNQAHICPDNCRTYLQNLYPVFLSCPLFQSVHLFRSRPAVSLLLAVARSCGVPMWPKPGHSFRRKPPFPLPHHDLNDFHARHGMMPRLQPPRTYEGSIDGFLQSRARDRFLVAVNIRQRQLTDARGSDYRDSPLQPWYRFFAIVAEKYPSVLFVTLGGFQEFEKGLLKYDNVIVLRTLGYGLGEELTLLHQSDLFMGTSSGFSAVATFSSVPYIITHIEHRVAPFFELEVGDPAYPFALPHQTLSWEVESPELLLHLFEESYAALRARKESERIPHTV
jgi:hypothetical protein